MRKFLTPLKDTTLYANNPTLNAGQDEILRVGKTYSSSFSNRSLMSFDLSSIQTGISNGVIPPTSKFFLNIKLANATNMNNPEVVYIYPVSQSWIEGTGTAMETNWNPSDGASWNYRSNPKLGLTWSGGSYYTNVSSIDTEVTCSLTYPLTDIIADVTNIVGVWLSGSIENNGFILKISDVEEIDSGSNANIELYSSETDTFYVPTLEVAWNDQIYVTASLNQSNIDNVHIGIKNLQNSYYVGTNNRINLSVRDQYPLKTFSNVFTRYAGNQFVPSSSYYSILEDVTNKVIIPFDVYSPLSCDSSGSYFMMDTSGMVSGRYYRILINICTNYSNRIFDTQTTFKAI